MKKIFFNDSGKLRNGWWIGVFLIAAVAMRFALKPLRDFLKGMDIGEAWLEPFPVLVLLLATWICTRLRKQPLASVGLQLGRRWFAHFGIGTAIGVGAMLLVVGIIWAIGGVELRLDPQRSAGILLQGLYLFLVVSLIEELLFRGFIFQRLIDGTGIWMAQALGAAFFAIAHWANPGMEGVVKVVATADIAIAAVQLGLAYYLTRSLALPIGLHLGWNWAQGHLLGFGVSGVEQTGWLEPSFRDLPVWLTGGEFGPEASVFAVLVDALIILALWAWLGRGRAGVKTA